MRAPPAPPQANGGMYLGGRTSSKTFAPVPITVPVPSSVPIAVFAWSPIRLPSSCRPVSRRVPAISRRTRPYVFFKFDVIVPAPRFAQRPITLWPTKPSCALFAYPRKTQLDSSPRAFVRGPIADARTGPPSTWAFAPTHKGPSSRAPARTSAPLDRKSTRLNSSHSQISYAVFCLKKKKHIDISNCVSPVFRRDVYPIKGVPVCVTLGVCICTQANDYST